MRNIYSKAHKNKNQARNKRFLRGDPNARELRFSCENTAEKVKELGPKQRRVYNWIIWCANTHGSVYPSQSGALSRYSGVPLRSINRYIRIFKEKGLLYLANAEDKKTNYYFIPMEIDKPEVRDKLARYLKALAFCNIYWMTLLGYPTTSDIQKSGVGPKRQERIRYTNKKRANKKIREFFTLNQFVNTDTYTNQRRRWMDDRKEEITKRITKALDLTQAGLSCLQAPFKSDVLESVLSSFLKLRNLPNNPFAWFFNACVYESNRTKYQIDWVSYYEICKAQEITEKTPRIQTSKQKREEVQSKYEEPEHKKRMTPKEMANEIHKFLYNLEASEKIVSVVGQTGYDLRNSFIQDVLLRPVSYTNEDGEEEAKTYINDTIKQLQLNVTPFNC